MNNDLKSEYDFWSIESMEQAQELVAAETVRKGVQFIAFDRGNNVYPRYGAGCESPRYVY